MPIRTMGKWTTSCGGSPLALKAPCAKGAYQVGMKKAFKLLRRRREEPWLEITTSRKRVGFASGDEDALDWNGDVCEGTNGRGDEHD